MVISKRLLIRLVLPKHVAHSKFLLTSSKHTKMFYFCSDSSSVRSGSSIDVQDSELIKTDTSDTLDSEGIKNEVEL